MLLPDFSSGLSSVSTRSSEHPGTETDGASKCEVSIEDQRDCFLESWRSLLFFAVVVADKSGI